MQRLQLLGPGQTVAKLEQRAREKVVQFWQDVDARWQERLAKLRADGASGRDIQQACYRHYHAAMDRSIIDHTMS